MLQVPFSFRSLKIVGIVGQPMSKQDKPHLYELAPRDSNTFILGYVPRLEDAQVFFKQHNINIADSKGVIRDNIIHDIAPRPELSGVDFQNIMNDIKQSYGIQSNNKTYICYAVDLKEARTIASDYLSRALNIKVLIKNLKLNANKNSRVEHANNLVNAYVEQLHDMNKYCTYDRYLVDCVKFSSSLNHTLILDDWVYQCY